MEELKQEAFARLGSLVDGKYELTRLLGVGGMGAVYEAIHRITERRVALKLLHPTVARISSVAERFLVEARAASKIDHPAIVQVLDADRAEDGALYVVFELLDGIDLGRAIARGRITPEILGSAMIQILNALSVAHQSGFVHRDIKPANIFLVRRKNGLLDAKLLDFGIARHLGREVSDPGLTGRESSRRARKPGGRLTRAGAVIGTPYFMSPEQMAGEDVDGRADLWSIGVVVYHALTGELPFKAQNYGALLAEMLNVGAPSLALERPDLSRRWIAVLDRALSPNLEDRFGTAFEMARALADCIRPAPIEKPAPSLPKKSAPAPKAPPHRYKWQDALDGIEREIEALEKRKPGLLEGSSSEKKSDR